MILLYLRVNLKPQAKPYDFSKTLTIFAKLLLNWASCIQIQIKMLFKQITWQMNSFSEIKQLFHYKIVYVGLYFC